MRSNTKLLLIGVLVLVLPALFVWAIDSIFTSAQSNIETAQKERVGIVHDTIRSLLLGGIESSFVQVAISEIYNSTQSDGVVLNGIKIYRDTPEGFVVLASTEGTSTVGQLEADAVVIRRIPFSEEFSFHFSPYAIDGRRIWQVYERVSLPDEYLYVFSQFDLTLAEQIMSARKLQAYFVLSFVFLFLIALAYWLRKQIDWENKYRRVLATLQDRDLFSNMMAHELRAPLTAVRGFASFLNESSNLTDKERHYVENIEISSNRLVELVNDFLEVARLHSGKLSIKKQSVDLTTLIPSALATLEELAREKGLSLRYETNHRAFMIVTDPDRLTQVIVNLVSNAIKYSERGIVAVACEDTRRGMTIRVKDTGTGISAEDQQKLFAQFSRVGGVDDKPITGSGLGMWITKQIVELLGGTIGVESIKGIGTHVVVTFKHN